MSEEAVRVAVLARSGRFTPQLVDEIDKALDRARMQERDRCAEIVETFWGSPMLYLTTRETQLVQAIARAIRARGEEVTQ